MGIRFQARRNARSLVIAACRAARATGSSPNGRQRALGVTALELLVVVAVAAVLVTLAVPSFGNLRRSASLSSAANQLLYALHLARSSALLNGMPVTLCLSADEVTCLGSVVARATGWLVFYEQEARVSAQPSPAQPPLHVFRLPEDVSVHGTRAAVTFWPVTRAGMTGTFDLCSPGNPPQGRAIVLSQMGRPRVVKDEAACAP